MPSRNGADFSEIKTSNLKWEFSGILSKTASKQVSPNLVKVCLALLSLARYLL